jgi:hypothetical protein
MASRPMPGSERSLRVTDAYRDRLGAFADRVATLTRQRWQQNVTIARLEESHALWLAGTVAALEQAQRAGVNLTLAYLAAFIASETDRRSFEVPAYDAARVVGLADTGQPLAEPLGKTLIGVKSLMADGKAPAEALAETGHRAERLAGSAVMAAPRRALADQIETHPAIVGWRRVTRGGCGACLAAAAHSYTNEPMRVHAHCHCSQEPIVRDVPDRAPRLSGPEIFARMTRAEQDQALGPAAAQAVRAGEVAWPDLIATSPMVVGPDVLTQAPLVALN